MIRDQRKDGVGMNKKNIIVFGAGIAFNRFSSKGLLDCYNILAVMDNAATKRKDNVVSPTDINKYQYDAVVITVGSGAVCTEMVHQLIELDVPKNKILIWMNDKPVHLPKVTNILPKSRSGRLFIDADRITALDHGTGVQRTINCLYKEFIFYRQSDFHPIRFFDGCITSKLYHCRITGEEYDGIENKVDFSDRDKLIISDWHGCREFINAAAMSHTKIYNIVYDLIPLSETLNCVPQAFTQMANKYLNEIMPMVDCFVCISKTVADEVELYFKHNKIRRTKPLYLYYFHLGVNFHLTVGEPKEAIRDFVSAAPTFLMVGTVEPRKNHLLILKMIKKMLTVFPEVNAQVLIIGHDGWMNQTFKDMYFQDDDIRRRVLWVKDANDIDLQWAYRNTRALLFPSKAEGFGLPIIEAAYFSLPIFCSDIPIFHEIAGGGATYLSIEDEEAWMYALLDMLNGKPCPDPGLVYISSWNESAKDFLDILEEKVEPYKIINP